jgi:Ca2+-binding EF-hand superfamily protein
MMAYERCFKRKMRSLFQFFDTDGDGKVSSSQLLEGLTKLKNHRTTLENMDEGQYYFDDEELIRCLPSPDPDGNFTLDAILQSSFSKLQLLQ